MLRWAAIVAQHVHIIAVQMMTDLTQQTCPFRVWGTFGFLTLVGFMGFSIYKGHAFNPAEYGGALAAYMIAWGGAVLAAAGRNKQ